MKTLYRRRIEHIACIPPPLSLACFPVYTSGIGASCRPLLSSPLSPSFALLLVSGASEAYSRSLGGTWVDTCTWLLVLARGMPSSTQSPRWELPCPRVLIICILNKNTYIYVYIYIYTYQYKYMYIQKYEYVSKWIYTYEYIYIQTCI